MISLKVNYGILDVSNLTIFNNYLWKALILEGLHIYSYRSPRRREKWCSCSRGSVLCLTTLFDFHNPLLVQTSSGSPLIAVPRYVRPTCLQNKNEMGKSKTSWPTVLKTQCQLQFPRLRYKSSVSSLSLPSCILIAVVGAVDCFFREAISELF